MMLLYNRPSQPGLTGLSIVLTLFVFAKMEELEKLRSTSEPPLPALKSDVAKVKFFYFEKTFLVFMVFIWIQYIVIVIVFPGWCVLLIMNYTSSVALICIGYILGG